VDEVQVNVEDGGRAFLFGDDVRVPDFLEESFSHSHQLSVSSYQ
jgi:hypothetical protein